MLFKIAKDLKIAPKVAKTINLIFRIRTLDRTLPSTRPDILKGLFFNEINLLTEDTNKENSL